MSGARVVMVVLLLFAAAACAKPRVPEPVPTAFDPNAFQRINELEHAMFERIWSRLDDPVIAENAVEQYAHAQAFLHTLTSRPASRSGAPHPVANGSGPVISPRMEERFGPAYVTFWYQRTLDWRERNKPALMQRLGLGPWEVDALLNGRFRIGDPWEHALVAWGSPTRVDRNSAGPAHDMQFLYANGKLRRVLISNGVVARVVE